MCRQVTHLGGVVEGYAVFSRSETGFEKAVVEIGGDFSGRICVFGS